MIEGIGSYGVAVLGVLVMIAILVWYKNRIHINVMEAGHLYMMYFFGAHTANEIMNEIDPESPQSATKTYWELKKLEGLGLIEREPEYDGDVCGDRHDESYNMTDAGEALYINKLAPHYELPCPEEGGIYNPTEILARRP